MWPSSEARPYFLLEGHHQAQLADDNKKHLQEIVDKCRNLQTVFQVLSFQSRKLFSIFLYLSYNQEL